MHVTPRSRPQSIRGVTERLHTGHGNMYVTVNFDENQKPFEVFGNLGKAGGCDSAQLEATTRLASLAFRSGIDPQEIIDQLQGITCCPAWDGGHLIKSSPDALALVLQRKTAGSNHSPHEHGQPQATGPRTYDPKAAPESQDARYLPALNGTRCPDCANQTVTKEGCLTCEHCGWSKCE